MTEKIDSTIVQAVDATVQEQERKPPVAGIRLVNWMASASHYVSGWWSPSRDVGLRSFWKRSNHLSGAIFSLQSKMTSIPFRILAKDASNAKHVEEAKNLTELINSASQFGDGWVSFFGKWVEDLLTQDNGAFAEVIGLGDRAGPIVGTPISVAHLDSARCQRTGNAIWPVIYTDVDGQMYKLHNSRVIVSSQMASPVKEMYGVGFCAVSRCIDVAQTLTDILTYKQEKLGSRPHRAIVITKGGLDPEDIRAAFQAAESDMTAQGLARYSKVVVTGSASMHEADLSMHELSSLPDGFDEQTSLTLGMAAIALAFGVDARELWPAMQSGATRADALLQHMKTRGKAPGQILRVIEQSFGHKVLPMYLKMVFDFQDDAQDRQAADIHKIRADARLQDLSSGALDNRHIRERMLMDSEVTDRQFEVLELRDGRLATGDSVLTLFYTNDKQLQDMLYVGTSDPLDVSANDPEAINQIINEKLSEISLSLIRARPGSRMQVNARRALSALTYLKKLYENPEQLGNILLGLEIEEPVQQEWVEDRVRNQDLTTPDSEETSLDDGDGTKPHATDDKVTVS